VALGSGAFFIACRHPLSQRPLFTLSALVSSAGQQLAMLVLTHFLSSLFYYAAQYATPFHGIFGSLAYHQSRAIVHSFLFAPLARVG
jgi:hypothetical protein